MTDNESEYLPPEPSAVLAELQRTIDAMVERDKSGVGVADLLRQARMLAGCMANAPAVAIVAGYQMKSNARVFYPAGWRPTDTNNFRTLVYAGGEGASEPEPHYVVRYVDRVGGPPGKTHALVSVKDWDAGMSRAVADQVCDDQGQPLVVYPVPAAGAHGLEAPCS